MFPRTILLIIVFYFLALLQASFLSHFGVFGFILNVILLAVILINLFIPDTYLGLFSAVIGGFFWDVFSSGFFGLHVLILLATAAFIHLILRKYVRTPLG